MLLPSLPIELVENVIDQATRDTKTLRSFALTCRKLLPRSRYHLFYSIRFQDTAQLYSFYDFLDVYPHVASFVISLALSTRMGDPQSLSLLELIPTPIFRKLPSLCVWKITDPDRSSRESRQWLSFSSHTLTCLKAHGTAIVELHLDSISFRNCAHFAEYIFAFRALKTLRGRDVHFKTQLDSARLDWVKQRLAAQLQLSTLIIGDDVQDDATVALMQSFPSTLLHLELVIPQSTELDISAIVSQLHGLRSLTLALQVHPWGDYNDKSQAELVLRTFHIINALSLHPKSRLQNLTIRLHCARILLFLDPLFNPHSYPTLTGCGELESMLLRLPSLRNIDVHYDGRHSINLMPLLEEYLPTLVRQRSVTFKFLTPSHCQQTSHDDLVRAVAVSPDSKWIASGSDDKTIILRDTQRRSVAHEWVAHASMVFSVAFSPDSQCLASAGYDYTVVLWNLSGPKVTRVATLKGHTNQVRTCVWSPDGATLVSGSVDTTVRIWDTRTYQQLHSLQDPSPTEVKFMRFSPDGRWIASGGWNTSCSVWDAATGDLRVILRGHRKSLSSVVFEPATGRIATASDDCTIRIWDVEAGAEALVVLEAGHTHRVRDVAFSPDGRRLVSGSYDKTVKVWDSFSGDLLLSLEAHTKSVTVVCFSPHGNYIASASEDKTVRLWRANDGVCIRTFKEHAYSITSLVYSPDGETLTSGGRDGKVCIRYLRDHDIPEEKEVDAEFVLNE